MFLKNRNAADDNSSPPYQLLLPCEDEVREGNLIHKSSLILTNQIRGDAC